MQREKEPSDYLAYDMAESASGQNETNPVFWLATRAGKMGLTCPIGMSRFGPARESSKLHWSSLFSQDGWILGAVMGRDEKRSS